MNVKVFQRGGRKQHKHVFVFPRSLLLNHLEPQSSKAKLLLPIMPMGIVAYAFILLWDNLCRNSCICELISTNTRSTALSSGILSSVKYESLGCYKDNDEDEGIRAIPSMEGTDALLKDSYLQRNQAIQKCAVAALTRGYKMFAIQDGGMCAGSPNAHKVYGKYGKSQDCRNDGKGGAGANQVYNLTGTMEGTGSKIV